MNVRGQKDLRGWQMLNCILNLTGIERQTPEGQRILYSSAADFEDPLDEIL